MNNNQYTYLNFRTLKSFEEKNLQKSIKVINYLIFKKEVLLFINTVLLF
jgi:hypothetical protein